METAPEKTDARAWSHAQRAGPQIFRGLLTARHPGRNLRQQATRVRIKRSLRVLNDAKFIPIIRWRAVPVSEVDQPWFDGVVELLVPNKQPLGELFMKNSGMRPPIDMVTVNPSGVESCDRRAPRNVAAPYQLPAPPREQFAVRLMRAGHKQHTGHLQPLGQ
jgi:hypothetical protein